MPILLVSALVAVAAAQGHLNAEGRAWLSVQVAQVSTSDATVPTRGAFEPEIDWHVWRPLGFDEQGPFGRLERFDVRAVRQSRSLHLEVARGEYVDLVAYGPGHGVTELRVTPDTSPGAVARPGARTVELLLPLASDERERVELHLDHDGTPQWFDSTQFRLWELSPSSAFWIRAAGTEYGPDTVHLGRSVLALSAGRHRLAVGAAGPFCGNGPVTRHLTVLPRVTLDVEPGSVVRWTPTLTRGTSLELRVECPGIALPPIPDRTDYDARIPWRAPVDDGEGELERWCAARLIARATGEVHEPRWGWDHQPWAHESGVFPLGIDVFTIQRLPPDTYTLEVRGPGIAPLIHEVTLAAPEMEPLTLTAERR